MAGNLGVLTLNLVARIGQFVEPMNQAERKARDASEGIADSFNTASLAAKAFGAVVAGASVAGVTAFVNQTINAGNEVQKFSQLANASMAQFQYYAKGAETAGISMESFADKMKDMQDRIGDFQQTGGGPLADFFENIAPLVGVTIQQFQKLSGPEALQLYYDSLQKVGATQNDMKFYMEAIISDSSLLIPLLENGGEGFKKWGDAAERANAIMSDEMIENLALAKENVQLLNLQWEGAKNTLINGSMPAIQATIDNMDALTNATMIAGAYLAGSYIPTLAIATKGLVTDTVAKISNIASTRAKTLADYEVAKANLAATAAMVRAMGVANAQTAAMMANARAAYQQAAAAKATMFAGSGLLGVLGGPVGLGITMASVAAGYLLMKDGAEKATASIDIQGKSVADLVVKYRELNTLQRDNETKALADQVEDLGLKYRVASSDLYSFMEALPISDEKIATFTKLNSELSQGRISSNEYYEAVKNVNILTDSQLSKVRGLVGGYVEAKNKFNEAETAQDALANSMGSTTQKAKEQAAEVAGLSEEIKKLLSTNKEAMLKNTSLNAMIGAGADPKLAEYLYEARKAQGILGTSKMLSEDVRKSVLARYNSEIGLNKTLEERAKIEERNKKLVEAQGNAMKVNALVAANAAKANATALESAKNLPKGLLSAVNMVESPHSNSAKSGAGAGGPMQFMPPTADRYKVDINSVESSYRGASNYLKDLLKMFDGDMENALRAYNWGEGNMQNYLKYGSGMKKENGKWQKGYFADKPMPKETREYSGKVMGYLGGSSGVSFTEDYSFDDWLKEQEQFAIEREKLEKEVVETKKAIQVSYYNEWQNLEYDNQERIKEIEKAFATDPTERDRLLGLQQKAYEDDVANWIKAQDDRVKAENEANQQIILARQNAFAMMNGPLGDMVQTGVEASARASMNPGEYQRWQMNNEQQDGYSQLGDSLSSARSGIENNEYLSETEKYQQLNDAYKVYLDGKKALTEEYAKQEAEYAQYQHDNQLSMYGSLLSQAGTVWGSMTEMVKDAAGEGSAAYKAMFLAQQAIAIGQAIINTELGATKALAEGGMIMGMPAATMVRAMGYASVGLIAAQTIQGMAHDGIDNIPKEGTWLLDKGERVVDSRTNADLKDYLAKGGGSGGGDVKISQSITFADGGAKVDTQGQKEIAQSLNNMMDAWARRESRQGGVLHKLARG